MGTHEQHQNLVGGCPSELLFLLGNAYSHLTTWRRKFVLDKLGSNYGSLAEESFPEFKKKLFGLGLEQKDTKRAETAKVISTSLGKLNHTLKKFFVFDPPKIQRRVGKAIIPVVRQQLFQRQAFNNRTTWKGGPFNRRGSSRRMPNISGL